MPEGNPITVRDSAAAGRAPGRRVDVGRVLVYAVLSVFALVVLVPLVATVLGGFKTLGDLRVNPLGLPSAWVWSNYGDILLSADYWVMLRNSLVVAFLAVVFTILVASMAAFAFSQLRFFGSKFLLGYVVMGLMFPTATAILPLFILIRDLGLMDSHIGLVLPKVAGGISVAVVLFANYFRNLPGELFDAAFVDGCGYFRFYWEIVLPLSGPIIATVAIINFVASWNTYFLPMVLLSTPELFTWPLGLMDYIDERGSDWQMICAFVTLTMLPMIVVFLAAQRHVISGLTSGAVKS
ncbi:MAG: carbohydrate ABC transporter permease [Gammaproteobacteria bacterium]|nr:carbohydrate ABC transporter permease [Gammaproteobacteria bacterium]